MQTERKKVGGGKWQFAICNLPFAIFIFLIAGCSSISLPSLPSLPDMPWSSKPVESNPTAEALFAEGVNFLNNKRYALAIERFQKVMAEFPFSPQLIPAELKLAEAYYLNKQYPEAAAAFKDFQTLHPTNENVPSAVYHLGMVHFEQFTSSDRDQKMTEIARGYFETVVKNFPGSSYAGPAKEQLAKCLAYLSEHEFNVVEFYFREKKYSAVIDRVEGILRRYRETAIAPRALFYLAESHRLEKNAVKATLAYEALIQYYPDHPLIKTAQLQLSELAKEKHDPMALLLKRDGRPASPRLESSQQSAVSGQQKQEKEPNLVAKKEVVREGPGDEKGMFRRVMDSLNPFASSADKKENGDKKTAAAKEESSGYFASLWSGLNPFAKEDKPKLGAAADPELAGKVDESLKQRGINTDGQNPAMKAPLADLPATEERALPFAETTELVGRVDTQLNKEGKAVGELPPPPEPSTVLRASATAGGKPAAARSGTATSPATGGLLAGIDEGLKKKGIETPKVELPAPAGGSKAETTGSARTRAAEKIELSPRLTVEKGPLFLDSKDYQAQRFDGLTVPSGVEGEKFQESPASAPVVSQPPKSAEPRRELPQAVVKGPQTAKEKLAETKAAEKKSPDEEAEPKGVMDQLKEDIGRLKDLLNPFGW